MEIPLLKEVIIILGLSVLVILTFQRIKLPTIVGFLITGMIAGPFGLSLVPASHEVEILSEIGVILLLFIIGLEFSLKSLAAIQKSVFIGGSVQVGLSILSVTGVFMLFQLGLPQSIFLGFLISLSSTAIVLKVLQERGEINSPHGKMSLAILIYQDIIVVPMMLFSPILAGQADNVWLTLMWLALKVVGLVIFLLVSARHLVPRLLYLVAKAKSRELFILTVVGLCFSVAFLTSSLGLSLALGAFMAGLIISESEYSHQATSNILPFREIFTSFFFVSVGMLLDLGFFIQHLPIILGLAIGVILLKVLIGFLSALVLSYPPRTVLLVGLSLFQVGEFSFILSKTGLQYGLIQDDIYQYFLAVSIVTMALTPFIIQASGKIADKLLSAPLAQRLDERMAHGHNPGDIEAEVEEMRDHLVIIGYGVNGKNVARAARYSGIPYVIIELNPDAVKEARAAGEHIIYGDAIHDHNLRHVQIYNARVAVIAISDPDAAKKTIVAIREICRTVYIITRTRFLHEMEANLALGANEVVPEELETSIEVFTRVLNKYLIPANEIEELIGEIRSEKYQMMRPNSLPKQKKALFDIPEASIVSLVLDNGLSHLAGKPLGMTGLRENFGVSVLAIKRDEGFITDLNRQTKLEPGDIIYVFGRQEDIAKLNG